MKPWHNRLTYSILQNPLFCSPKTWL